MEEKLRAIVVRIEQSSLDGTDKEKLYQMIAASLQAIALPILVKHMPKDELKDLADNPPKVTVASYLKLLDDTLIDGQALAEIQMTMDKLLAEVDATLKDAGL